MIKKALYIYIPFILIMIGILINNNLSEKTIFSSFTPNYLYQNKDDYNIFFLNLEDMNITTKNIKNYFDNNTDIISITPFINPIYKNKLSFSIKYNFKDGNLDTNINNFISYYDNIIRESGYIKDLENLPYQGIKINEICLYEKNINIYNLIKSNPKIKYRNTSNGVNIGI